MYQIKKQHNVMIIKKSFFFFLLLCLSQIELTAQKTIVEIKGNQFYINGKPTYEGRVWKGNKIEGLLMNSRMVQGVFDDLNIVTRDTFAYADTKKWGAERNNAEFIAAMPLWKSYGLNSFTLNMQGGSPFGYGNFDFYNPGFNPDGSLHPEYMKRLDNILRKADDLEMVVILGFFYFGQDQRLKDETAIKNAVANMVNWLHDKKYRHILIEINNETLSDFKQYDHAILLKDRVHELINLAKGIERNGYRYYVTTSFPAIIVPTKNVVDASDFVLFHGNSLRTAQRFTNYVAKVRAVVGNRIMPIVINEDDNYAFESDTCNMNLSLKNYISWGYFDYRKRGFDNDPKQGFQTIPVDWGVNSERKKSFFNKLKEITQGNPNPSNIFYQYNIWWAFVNKVFEGDLTVEAARKKGDIGLGSYNLLDGELIQLDGVYYQAKEDGSVVTASDKTKIAYLNTTFFKPEKSFILKNVANYDSLRKRLNEQLPTKNIFYSFKIHGTFKKVKCGGLHKQEKPFNKGLDYLIPNRPIFEREKFTGTLVGFYCPDFIGNINASAYHLHFISDDRKFGGHLMELEGSDLTVEVDFIHDYQFSLPQTQDFDKVGFDKEFQYKKN
jgi:alpha-acetolactate decarboxylase